MIAKLAQGQIALKPEAPAPPPYTLILRIKKT